MALKVQTQDVAKLVAAVQEWGRCKYVCGVMAATGSTAQRQEAEQRLALALKALNEALDTVTTAPLIE